MLFGPAPVDDVAIYIVLRARHCISLKAHTIAAAHSASLLAVCDRDRDGSELIICTYIYIRSQDAHTQTHTHLKALET